MNGMVIAAPLAWDEACFSVPAVRALMASGLPVTILCPVVQERFWKTLPGLSIIHYLPKANPKGTAAVLGGFEAAVVWENGVAAEACQRAKISRRTGPSGDKALMKLLTDPLPRPAPGPIKHRVRHYLSLPEAMGIGTRVPAFFEPVDLGIPPAPGSVLLAPDSDYGRSHEWPLERWEKVAQTLIESGRRPTIVAVANGGGLAEKLVVALGEEARFLRLEPLGESLPILAAHEKVIAADGSLPHLAAHAGSTCVVLFGPNEPAWKRPLGKRHTVLRRHVECAPCFAAKCVMDLRCQMELTLEKVLAAM
jgi:ADP-heptose:LPS heptosyltransferase